MRAKIAAAVAAAPFNRYPDAGAAAVVAALRVAAGVPDAQGVLLGNGSDELIEIITCALARPGAVMLAPEPTFVMYRMNALYSTMRFVGVPLTATLELDVAAMEAAIECERPALIFLASPNNPTGNRFATADVLRILRAAPGLVVVDEAYTALRAELPAADRRIPEPPRPAHGVEDRHGGVAARVCRGRTRMDRRIGQGAPAV